jgi:hypothetical protein
VATIGDLIEVPPVRTVIRLEEGRSSGEEIVASFVFTPEVAAHFSVITDALLSGRGQGYFLQGDFGSGKSHFLAALYAWLAGGEARDPLDQRHGGLARLAETGKRFLPVDISLVNYRATTSLESIVVESVIGKLAEEAPEPAAGGERRETFSRLLDSVREAGYDGLFLLIDELSEFFRSKPTPQALNEDARTLQLLGEMASRQPLWIIAAVQESIEATGDVSQAILRKIKDRFPVRLGLSTLHVRSLIGGRLVRKKPGADAEIARIHEHFRGQFATFTVPFEDFRACYPVHPATLSLLEGLGDLFSQHRGIVDFVCSRIAGDKERGIAGILGRPAAELLGPDSIYDHFAPRLAEISAFHAYPRRIIPHLDEVIGNVIASEDDRALAHRLVRMLVLYKVHPTARAPTVSHLAELASCSLGGAQPSLNARYVSEVVLDPVVQGSRFLVRSLPPSGDAFQAVYGIAVEEDPGKLLDARLRSAMGEIVEDDARLLVEPLSQIGESESWPGAAVWEEGARRGVSWSSSARTVLVRFLHGETEGPFADRLSYDIAEKGFDFALVLAIGDASIQCPHAAVWRISLPKKNPALREFLALRAIAARATPSNPADMPLVPLLKERIARIAPAAYQAAQEALYAGEFSDPRIRVEPSVRQIRRFDRLLEVAAEVVLEARYPRFREVAPRKILPSPRLYQQLLEAFVLPGSVPLAEARTRSLSPLIDGLAAPLGLVETKRGAYVFSPDASGYPLIPHLLSLLSPSRPTPMPDVLANLEGSPFGLPHDTAVFLVAALVIGGLLSARKGGRAIPLDYLNLQSVEKADEIALGELIAEPDRETLVRECAFLSSVAGVQSFGLRQQREAWKEVIKFRDSALQLVDALGRSFGRMAEFSSFQGFGLDRLERSLSGMRTLAESIKVSYQAKEGLEAFIRAWRGTGLSSGEVLSLRKLAKFLAEKAEEFIFIAHYLRHPAVEKASGLDSRVAELRATGLALLESPEAGVVNDGGEHLSAVFVQFRDAYGAQYAREHAGFHQARQAPSLSRAAQRALDALRRLAVIQALDRPSGLDAFLRDLAPGSHEPCKRRLSEELLRSPLCGCGFSPGDAPPAPRARKPEESIDRFLHAYCEILGSPRVLEAAAARAFALQDVQVSSAEKLRRLAEILRRGKASPAEISGAIDEDTATELDRALSGRVAVRPRSLAALVSRLAGRRLPPRTILSLVSDWLAEASEEVLISVDDDIRGIGSTGSEKEGATDAAADAESLWPLVHAELLERSPHIGGPRSAGEAARLEQRLEGAFPSARLREVFAAADSRDLLGFMRTERFHTEAVRAAWLVLAERIVGGQKLPAGFAPESRHADPEKARRVAALLEALGRANDLLAKEYPERLSVRIPFEELLFDSWTSRELGDAVYRSLEQVSRAAAGWLSGVPAVQAIPLENAPVVIIFDGVPADVWMRTGLETGIGQGEEELSGCTMSWGRLDVVPATPESISSLFALSGDPQERLVLGDSPMLTLRGDEERSLKELLLPLAPKKPAVVRISLLDKAAHARGLRLSEMAAALSEIVRRDLPALRRECARQKRELIVTTDHGLSLSRDGLSHGRGGAYERLIFRALWAP